MRLWNSAWASVSVLLALYSGSGSCHEVETPKADANWIGGHFLIRSALVASPVVSHWVSSSIEGGTASFLVNGAEAPINTLGLSPSLETQFKAGPVGIELSASLNETTGSDAYSALLIGANFSYSLGMGVRYPLMQRANWVLTPAVFGTFSNGGSFTPLNAAIGSILSLAQANAQQFLASRSSSVLRAALLWAYVPHPAYGFSFEISRGFGSTSTGGSQPSVTDSGYWRAGAVASANLASNLHVPLGVLLGAREDWPNSGFATPLVEVGIVEMSRRDFNFSAELYKLMSASSSLSCVLRLIYYY